MNRIFCLFTVTLLIFCQSISNARAAEAEMSDDDFTKLVCGYLHSMEDKNAALNEIYAEIEFDISDYQFAMLEDIENSDAAIEDYCSSAMPRF